MQNLRRLYAAKGEFPGDRFEQQNPEGEDIGALVHLPPACLFRRHVIRSSQGAAADGFQLVSTVGCLARRRLRKTEIGYLELPLFCKEHVRGLNIAVNYAVFVSVGQAFRDLDRPSQHSWMEVLSPVALRASSFWRRVPPGRYSRTRNLAVLVSSMPNMVAMRAWLSAEIARFLAETGNAFRSAHGMVRNELERDKSPKVRISCLIDHAHTAFTQFSNDFVTGYSPGLMPWVYIELHGKRT